VAVVKKGTVMFELSGLPEYEMKEALRKAGDKLAVVCRVVRKGELKHE
jgi:large subunit ribosomal protein L16